MTVLEYILGSLLILVSIVLIIVVMMQKSREGGLSGAIAGGSDTFFDKHKGRTIEAKMALITKWLGGIFFVLAMAATLLMLFF